MGIDGLRPVANMMVKQMLFMDPPAHSRIRRLAADAFTPQRVAALRDHIQGICDRLLDAVLERGTMEVFRELAAPLPANLGLRGLTALPLVSKRARPAAELALFSPP